MSADSTLAAINGALDSWERGEDAARWRPGGDAPDELDPPGYGLIISDSTGITFTNCHFACAACGEPIPGGGHRDACWPTRQAADHPVLPVTGEQG